MNTLLLKTLRDLRASLAQSIALIVIVMLGVASFAATVAAYRDLDTSYNRTYDELLFADVTFAVQGAPQPDWSCRNATTKPWNPSAPG
jgi:predicted lysophospholipase L1 biosynthesis ABC-type transport system permease subunit